MGRQRRRSSRWDYLDRRHWRTHRLLSDALLWLTAAAAVVAVARWLVGLL